LRLSLIFIAVFFREIEATCNSLEVEAIGEKTSQGFAPAREKGVSRDDTPVSPDD
jgi:hypothetical protein